MKRPVRPMFSVVFVFVAIAATLYFRIMVSGGTGDPFTETKKLPLVFNATLLTFAAIDLDVRMFMEDLKKIIHGNHHPLINNDPLILSKRPQFQLLYQELDSIIQTLSNIHEISSRQSHHKMKIGSSSRIDHRQNPRWIRLKQQSQDIVVGLDRHAEIIREKAYRRYKAIGVAYCRDGRTREESWELLKQKVFHGDECPERLIEPGTQNCKKMSWTTSFSGCHGRSSSKRTNEQRFVGKIACTGLPEDFRINVKKGDKLWVAEGLLKKLEIEAWRILAKAYLMDLTNRNLVIVAKRNAIGECSKYLEFLPYLENLKLLGRSLRWDHIAFPATLKKVSLINCDLPWSHMSVIQLLPNLEVLKLDGNLVTTGRQWDALSDCEDLEEIPLEIGDIATLELIEIDMCNNSVVESVKRIQQEQHDMGNYELNITVNRKDLSFYSSQRSSESD
ncbi:hypothetical protein OSB04_018042 [Centaurea solstitialis]|uniref:Uncharacterized protein n=1 Tax=Centaurea solstitialis TaxID=347529 RepID=A0AA38WB68_9ASTR|nr:hypothetical protein OSB04_018042 [Centaurea solstitialis]